MGEVMRWQMEQFSCDKIEAFWPSIASDLDKMPHLWSDYYTKEALFELASTKHIQVWGIGRVDAEMILFTQIGVYPAGNILEIFLAFGEDVYKAAGDVVDYTLEEFAKLTGCNRMNVVGRFGWERELKGRGFQKTSIVLSRKVVHRGMQ